MKKEFSKTLLVQESVLIWLITLSFIALAYIAIINEYSGSLPWLAAFPTVAWGAYAISQSMYYRKSAIENQAGGLRYEATMLAAINEAQNRPEENYDIKEVEIDPFGPI